MALSGEFPLLSQFMAHGGQPQMPGFEVGLERLLDGFEAQLRR
jgi:hypothetical protein